MALKFCRALPVDRLVDGAPGRATRACGTRRTASSTTCSGCPTAGPQRLKVRSMVGLLPLCAATVFEGELHGEVPGARGAVPVVPRRPSRARAPRSTTRRSPASPAAGSPPSSTRPSSAGCWRRCSTRTSSSAPTASARCRATTPTIRTSSTPAARSTACPTCRRSPTPACSAATRTGAGPIWMPVNALIIRALLQYYLYYGDDFTVECPTGSGRQMNLYQVAEEIARRLANIFLQGRGRPAAGLRRHAEVPGRPALARLPAVLRVLPRRQRGRPRGQPPDRLDRDHRPDHAPVRDHHARAGPGGRQEIVCRDAGSIGAEAAPAARP